jgi:glycosyltransferase involved in cell wall biosynthesis
MTRQQTTGGVRVLFVSDHFGHAGGVIHGATRYFLTVLPRLQQNGIELSAAFLREPHPAAGRLREKGVDPRFFGRAKWNPLTVLDVWRVLKRERIEVIHAAGMKGILTARIAGRIAGVPVIAHLHDCMPVSPALARPLRWTSGWAAHTLAVSREVASFAQETLNIDPAGTEVLTNGMVIDEIQKTPAEAGLAFRERVGITADAEVIGIIGRLVPVKGHDALLRAMPGVLAKVPTARLLIVGDGPERKNLEARAHELGLSGYVFFVGYVTDVYAALRAVDVCAMPSLSEGLPYSLLEAMAMGKPVVASAVGGLAETLRHCENGVLVRPNDAQALTKALVSVLTDALLAETVVKGGRESIRGYDIANHVDRVVTIYRALAAGDPVPPITQAARPETSPAEDKTETTQAQASKTPTSTDAGP